MALVPTPRFAPFWALARAQSRSSPLPFALCSRLALALLLKPLSRKSFVLGSAVNRSITDRSDARKSSNFFCVNTTQHLQKISTGISLVVLAVGFSLIGLTSVLHPLCSGDAPDFNGTSCALGGTAGLVAGTIFLVAALLYWRRSSELPVTVVCVSEEGRQNASLLVPRSATF
jgi:hypothetical protein